MIWTALRDFFQNRTEIPFGEETMETLVLCVTDALKRDKDADPTIIVKAAATAGKKAQTIDVRNLYRYTMQTIRREVWRSRRLERQNANNVELKTSEEIDGLTTQAFRIEEAVRTQSELVVDQYLSSLPELDREIFWLREYEDLDHSTIAAALNITVANSRFKLCQTKKTLKALFPRYSRAKR